jgi:hypothetical protein
LTLDEIDSFDVGEGIRNASAAGHTNQIERG